MYQLLRKRLAGKKGFTLIELIVVIAIIAILAVVLIPRFAGFTTGARQRAALSEARSILTALEALDAEGRFPSGNDADIQAAVEGYLGKDLEDGVLEHVSNAGGINFTYTRTFGSSAPVVVTCAGGVLSDPASPTTT